MTTTSAVTIDSVTMSLEAAQSVEETGIQPSTDVRRVRSGRVTTAALLAECLDGADDDRADGWREYVAAVAVAAAADLDTYTLTDSHIRALQYEAAAAGDLDMVATCRLAAGDREEATQGEILAAQRVVCRAINDAAAQS